MLRLLDTSIAILLRDADPRINDRVAALDRLPALSILTVVELEGGVASSNLGRAQRRRAVDEMLAILPVLPFGTAEAAAYGRIVADVGFSRPKIIDRMIAAQAIMVGATLATLNPRDFRGIRGLRMEDWSAI
jgi:predicted nucleic acid-binding protein